MLLLFIAPTTSDISTNIARSYSSCGISTILYNNNNNNLWASVEHDEE